MDREAAQKDFAAIDENRRAIDDALEQVGKLSNDETGQQPPRRARESWRAYGVAAQTSKDLLDKDKLSDAQRKLTDEVVPLLGALIDAFSAFANHQGELIELARTQGHERYYAGRALVIALIVLASLAAVVVATLVTRSIVGPDPPGGRRRRADRPRRLLVRDPGRRHPTRRGGSSTRCGR